ncbi:MAG: hypothetical protein HUK02_03885 [Bacteroidaceae bacterium]|nr:hypothetical protein [Bacteroidaceae bacterium]
MKTFLRNALVALSLALFTLPAAAITKAEAIQKDSASASLPTNSAQLETIEYDREMTLANMKFEHEKEMLRLNNLGGSKFKLYNNIVGGCVAIAIILVIFIGVIVFFTQLLKHRRQHELTNNEFILNVAKTEQPLTPELIESLRTLPHMPQTKKRESLTFAVSMLVFGLGCLCVCLGPAYHAIQESHGYFFYVIAVFFFARGLGGTISWYIEHKQPTNEQ